MKNVAATLANLKTDMSIFRDYIMANMVTRNEFQGRFDAFSRDVEAAQRDRAVASDQYMKHQELLSDHERRLSQMESRQEKP